MALDKQRILGELGSVMQQLQGVDCGCLGKLFEGPQQTTQCKGSPIPTYEGCRRTCCCGHGYSHYNQPTPLSQTVRNRNPTQIDANNFQQPMAGNTYGMGPQIVNMMKSDNHKHQNMPVQGQGHLTGPMVIDAPHSPHGKVGLTPFTPTAAYKQGQFNPPSMNQAGVTEQFIQPTSRANTSNMNSWPQQNMATTHQMVTPQTKHRGQHSQGISKFNQMFPGVKQGLGGGNLAFDPMAIAIQMNPENHFHSAMDTMHKIMNDNRGMDKILNNPTVPQPEIENNSNVSPNPLEPNATMQQKITPHFITQDRVNRIVNEQMHDQNVTDQVLHIPQETANLEKQGKYPQNQKIYSTIIEPSSVNQQRQHVGDNQQFSGQDQYQQMQKNGQQQIMDLNLVARNSPVEYDATADNNQIHSLHNQPDNYVDRQQTIKEPIFPADSSRNMIYVPSKVQKNYEYNTLGQPFETLPAKMFHPPEPSLPQTLSPQANPTKPRDNTPKAVKATVSRTSLAGKRPVGRNPSRSQLQHIYNQYKGSQSYTQQNIRQPSQNTHSDGRLNTPQTNVIKALEVPVERVGGDTIVNNQPNNRVPIHKVERVIGEIGDVPTANSTGDTSPVKEIPEPISKCRNGLQDIVFSSYPISAAWTFHGHGLKNHSLPAQRFRNRQY